MLCMQQKRRIIHISFLQSGIWQETQANNSLYPLATSSYFISSACRRSLLLKVQDRVDMVKLVDSNERAVNSAFPFGHIFSVGKDAAQWLITLHHRQRIGAASRPSHASGECVECHYAARRAH